MPVPPSLWKAVGRIAASGYPPETPEEVQSFIEAAARQRLLPFLQRDQTTGGPLRSSLDQRRALVHVDRQRTAIMADVFSRICRIISPDRLIVLKGMDYAYRLYPEPHLRPMADIDVLLDPEELDQATKQFIDAGAMQLFLAGPSSLLPGHHERVFRFHGVTVELHKFFIQPSRLTVDYANVWARREPLEIAGMKTWRLSDTDAFVHHAVSMAIDELDVSLVRLVDVWLMLQRGVDFDEVVDLARQWSATHPLYGMLHQVTTCFPEAVEYVPREWRRFLPRRESLWLERAVLPPWWDASSSGRLIQLWRKFWLLDSMTRRFSFLVSSWASWSAARTLVRR